MNPTNYGANLKLSSKPVVWNVIEDINYGWAWIILFRRESLHYVKDCHTLANRGVYFGTVGGDL